MRSWFRLHAFLFAFTFLNTPLWAQEFERPKLTAKDIEPTLRSDWYGVYLDGTKVGYMRSSAAKTDTHYVQSMAIQMKLVSNAQKVEVNFNQNMKFDLQAPYALADGVLEVKAGGSTQTIAVKRGDKGYAGSVRVGDSASTIPLGKLDYTFGDVLATELWLKRNPPIGASILTREFDMEKLELDPQKCTLLSVKESLVSGVSVRYFEIEQVSLKTKVKFVARFDDQGKMLSGNLSGQFEFRLESEEQAKDTKFSRDLFVLGSAKLDRPLGTRDIRNVTELVVEIPSPGKVADGLEDGPRQTILRDAKGPLVVKLGRRYGKEAKATPKEIERALAETTAYCISNEKVKTLAAKAVGDAKTPEEKVKNIVEFVHGYIHGKYTNRFPNMHDLMQNREGDCKSYALMTTTLCRAAGVPSREVSGLVYTGDSQQTFGGHAWNEVVLNERWVPVDASLAETELDATHICFGTEDQAARTLLESLGKLSLKLVEVKTK